MNSEQSQRLDDGFHRHQIDHRRDGEYGPARDVVPAFVKVHIRENFFRNYLSCKSNDLTRFFQPYYAKCVYSHLFHHFFCGASAVAAGAAMAVAADPAAFPDPLRLRRRDGFAEGAGAGLGAFFGAAVAADLFPAAFAALRAAFCSVLRAGRCAGCCPASASRAGRCADLAPAFRAGFGSWVRAGRCAAFCAGFRAGAALRRAYSGTGPSVGIVSPVSFWMSCSRYSNSSSEQNDHRRAVVSRRGPCGRCGGRRFRPPPAVRS